VKILLTGATGFIGSNLFSSNPSQFRCVIRRNNTKSFTDSYLIDSFTDSTCWAEAFSGVNAVIHLAGLAHSKSYSECDYNSVNVEATLNLAKQAATSGIKRFVFVSSIVVNGPFTFDQPFTNRDIPNPLNVYAKSKLKAEIGLKQIASDTGMELVIVRPTLVYGPNAPGNFASLCNLVKILPFLPFGGTQNKRHFISVHNLADLLIVCAKHPNAAGHVFLASDNNTISTKEFTNAIAVGLNKKILQIPIPLFLIRLAAKIIGKSTVVEQLFGNLEVDSSNLKGVLEWSPPYTMRESMASLKQDDNKSFIND
jgi:nucleoside-diphosphate-sugar epimerase